VWWGGVGAALQAACLHQSASQRPSGLSSQNPNPHAMLCLLPPSLKPVHPSPSPNPSPNPITNQPLTGISTSFVSILPPFFASHFLYIVNTGRGHLSPAHTGKSSMFTMNAESGNRSDLAPLMAAVMHAICGMGGWVGWGVHWGAVAESGLAEGGGCIIGVCSLVCSVVSQVLLRAAAAAPPRSISPTAATAPPTPNPKPQLRPRPQPTHPPMIILPPQPLHLDRPVAHDHQRRVPLPQLVPRHRVVEAQNELGEVLDGPVAAAEGGHVGV